MKLLGFFVKDEKIITDMNRKCEDYVYGNR